jgi:hypothetical protein
MGLPRDALFVVECLTRHDVQRLEQWRRLVSIAG